MARPAAGFLVVLAALLALPSQAQAQTEVWSGTLTVRDLGFGEPGCSNTVSGSHCSAHLTDDDFTHDSTDYAVGLIFLRTNGQLEIEFDTDLTTATQGLTLNVDGTAFAFEDADSKPSASRIWFSSGLSWSAGDTVSLTLIEPADATLSDLVLEDNAGAGITLTPTFVTGTTRYTASVASSVSAITLTPTVNDASATVEYLNASNAAITDTDTTTPALDAPLVVGANTFKVKVTAGNTTPTTTTYRVVVTRAADTTPPSPESAAVATSGTSVSVTFNEDLDIAVQILPAAVVAAFTVTADGVDLNIANILASTTDSLNIRLPTGTAISQNQTVTVSYDKTAAGTDALEDAAGNEVATFTDFAVTNNSTVADTIAPSPESASVATDGRSVTLHFNEDLDIAVEILPTAVVNAFTLTADGGELDIQTIASNNPALVFTLVSGTTIEQNQTVKLSYDKTAAGTDALEDAAENEVSSFTDFAVTNNSTVDTTAPRPESAEVRTSGTSIELVFDEVLDVPASLPAALAGAFSVTASGADLPISGVVTFGGSPVRGLLIVLTAGTTISSNQTVKLSYNKTTAGTDALEDAADNEVASFTDFAVTNNSNVAPNSPPVFPSTPATRDVAENTAAGQNVGAVLTATDADNDTLTYTLEGTDSASFDLVTISGSAQIRTKSGVTYDHETKSSYAVTVKADDGNGGTDTIAVTITVTDVNEPPDRPAAPSVSSVANSTTSLEVTWTAPATTGPDIDNYDLRYREGTSGGWTNGPQNVNGTSATIMGLTANTLYQVQVLATNNEGDSPWSLSGSGQTNTAGNTAPVFPSSTATRSVPENSPAGTDVGNAITATDADGDTLTYTLEGTDAASFDLVTISGSAQIRTRSGVTYDREARTSYAVIVKADDGNGGADTVTVTITVTDVAEPPRAPAAPTVTATPNTTDSLSVSWRAPSNTGRPAIDDYDLQYREGTTGNWDNGPQSVSGTSATIAGLTAAPTAYQVQVRATNDEGDGPWSPPGRIRTTPPPPSVGPPSPTRDLTATAGDQAVELSWRRPADDGGAPIVRYEYRQQDGDGPFGAWQIIEADPPPTDHTVTGLTNGVSYTFQVRAVNRRRASQPSEPASATPEPELEPLEVAIVGLPDIAVAGESYELTAQSDAEEALVYAWRVAYGEGGSVEPSDTQAVMWTAPSGVTVAWIRVDVTREEDGATAGQSAYVRVDEPEPEPDPGPDVPEPVPALPLLGQLLLALGLGGAGARFLSRRPRVPPAA